jgi:hypothetical protein
MAVSPASMIRVHTVGNRVGGASDFARVEQLGAH